MFPNSKNYFHHLHWIMPLNMHIQKDIQMTRFILFMNVLKHMAESTRKKAANVTRMKMKSFKDIRIWELNCIVNMKRIRMVMHDETFDEMHIQQKDDIFS